VTTAVIVVVATGVAVATEVGVLRTGEGVDVATEVGEGVAAVFVGVGVVTLVGVEVGVGDGVVVGEAVIVGLGEGLSVGMTGYFAAEFEADVALAALVWIPVTIAIAPINENSISRMDSTPTSIPFGVCIVYWALSERCFLPESASRLFFIFVSLDSLNSAPLQGFAKGGSHEDSSFQRCPGIANNPICACLLIASKSGSLGVMVG
jgi:hypothetical protein